MAIRPGSLTRVTGQGLSPAHFPEKALDPLASSYCWGKNKRKGRGKKGRKRRKEEDGEGTRKGEEREKGILSKHSSRENS